MIPLVFGGLTLISFHIFSLSRVRLGTPHNPNRPNRLLLRLKISFSHKHKQTQNAESQAQAAATSFDATSSSSTTVSLSPWPPCSSSGSTPPLAFFLFSSPFPETPWSSFSFRSVMCACFLVFDVLAPRVRWVFWGFFFELGIFVNFVVGKFGFEKFAFFGLRLLSFCFGLNSWGMLDFEVMISPFMPYCYHIYAIDKHRLSTQFGTDWSFIARHLLIFFLSFFSLANIFIYTY